MTTFRIFLIILLSALLSCNDNDSSTRIDEEVDIEELLKDPINIQLNPYELTPLSAVLTVNTESAAHIEATVLGDYPSITETENPGTAHQIDIHGLYPDHNNAIKIKVTEENGRYGLDTIFIQTDSLPSTFPDIEIVAIDESRMEPGWNLIELSIGGQGFFRFNPVIFDPSGQIRWYMNLDFIEGWIGPFERLDNGNWLWSHNNRTYEYNMLGQEVRNWELWPYSQHHDQVEKPDGNLIISVSKWEETTALDHIIEIDRQDGSTVREWDLREVLDVDRFDFVWNSFDWAHVNSVWYDTNTDGLVVSARHQGIVKVDIDNNLEWIIAPHQGWNLASIDGDGIDTRDYLLTAIDANGNPYPESIQQGSEDAADGFSWPWGQHAAMVLDNGHIFCFDNGTNKHFDNNATYSRGVEYAINAEAMTISQVWQYGKERGIEMHSNNISDVDVLPITGNRLMAPGNLTPNPSRQTKLIEVSYPDGEVIYEAVVTFKDGASTGAGWAETDISYRAERLEIYPK